MLLVSLLEILVQFASMRKSALRHQSKVRLLSTSRDRGSKGVSPSFLRAHECTDNQMQSTQFSIPNHRRS